MDRKPRWDFTQEHWFSNRTSGSRRHSNILLDIVPNFDYLQTYGQNTLERITHYIGENNILDQRTGYVLRWDGRHCCDRCGAVKELSGDAKRVRLAYALKELPWMKKVGLCLKCEMDMYNEDKDLISDTNSLFWTEKQIPNDWDEYIWL